MHTWLLNRCQQTLQHERKHTHMQQTHNQADSAKHTKSAGTLHAFMSSEKQSFKAEVVICARQVW